MENLMHSKVYVGTYAKYNNGSIKGDWIELSNFSSIDECYDLSDFVKSYFDYESFAKDLFIGDYTYENGHVFRNS